MMRRLKSCQSCRTFRTRNLDGICARCRRDGAEQIAKRTEMFNALRAARVATLERERHEVMAIEQLEAMYAVKPRLPISTDRTRIVNGVEFDIVFDGAVR